MDTTNDFIKSEVLKMTPEEFKIKAQALYNEHNGYAGEEGHIEVDYLLTECLNSLGYKEGTDILWSMRAFWYS